jgi:CheY-like chemotaxis protein
MLDYLTTSRENLTVHKKATYAGAAELPAARVLIAEDIEDTRLLLRLMLRNTKINPTFVTNGEEALQISHDETFDLILMDMQMPRVNGYIATAELRKAGLTIPIVALTANALLEDQKKTLEAGCSACLLKPFRSEELFSLLRSLL